MISTLRQWKRQALFTVVSLGEIRPSNAGELDNEPRLLHVHRLSALAHATQNSL